jgi:hypothetical protein
MEWDYFEKTAKKHQIVKKSPLIKLISKHLLQIIGILRWAIKCIPWNTFSQIEMGEIFVDTVIRCKLSYVRKAKIAWNVTSRKQESNKSIWVKKM